MGQTYFAAEGESLGGPSPDGGANPPSCTRAGRRGSQILFRIGLEFVDAMGAAEVVRFSGVLDVSRCGPRVHRHPANRIDLAPTDRRRLAQDDDGYGRQIPTYCSSNLWGRFSNPACLSGAQKIPRDSLKNSKDFAVGTPMERPAGRTSDLNQSGRHAPRAVRRSLPSISFEGSLANRATRRGYGMRSMPATATKERDLLS